MDQRFNGWRFRGSIYFRTRPQCLSKLTNISDHWLTCEKFISSRYELFQSAPTIWAWRLLSWNTLLKFWTISSHYYLVSQVDMLHEGMSKHQNMCFNPLLLSIKGTFLAPSTCNKHSKGKLDGVGPVDNRPSTDKLHHFVRKKNK